MDIVSSISTNIHQVTSIHIGPSELLGEQDTTCIRVITITTKDGGKYSITTFNYTGPVPLIEKDV